MNLWIENGQNVRDTLLKNEGMKLIVNPKKGGGGAPLHHAVLESWNKDALRWMCRSGHSYTHRDLRMAASIVIDEAHLPNVMNSVLIIDLLTEDPRLGGKSPCAYYNISLYVIVGVGEDHILTWARKRLFQVVSLNAHMDRLLGILDAFETPSGSSVDAAALTAQKPVS